MRIVAGIHGGRRLIAPKGTATRPTSDRVREALFSMLGDVGGARVLDLFAGSGALGFEALSRGAAHVTAVDNAARAAAAVKANAQALEVPESDLEIQRRDARAFLRTAQKAGRQYDLVFVDPPYRHAAALGADLSEAIPAVLATDARVVTESDRRSPLDLALELKTERRYGDTLIRLHVP